MNFNLISQSQTPGWAEGVWITGDTAFIADGEYGITIWDISDLNSPTQIDELELYRGDYASQVIFSELLQIIFVRGSGYNSCVRLYDMNSKKLLMNIGDYGQEDFCVNVIDSVTFEVAIVDKSEGFRYVMVYYDPEFKEWYTAIYGAMELSGGSSLGLCIDGEYAFVAQNQRGFRIIQINADQSEFTADLRDLGNWDTPGAALDIVLNGRKTHAIIADSYAGIQVVDVTDKDTPIIVGSLQTENIEEIFRVKAVGDTIYFLDRHNGIYAADISKPEEPVLLANYPTPAPSDIFIKEDHTIFMTDQELGILVFEW